MEELISPAVAAKMLGVSVMTLRNWAEMGSLQHIKTIGGHRRYKLTDINKLLNTRSGVKGVI